VPVVGTRVVRRRAVPAGSDERRVIGIVEGSRSTDAGWIVTVTWASGSTSEHAWGAPIAGVAVNFTVLRAAQGTARARFAAVSACLNHLRVCCSILP
jgi:hypothetical protein